MKNQKAQRRQRRLFFEPLESRRVMTNIPPVAFDDDTATTVHYQGIGSSLYGSDDDLDDLTYAIVQYPTNGDIVNFDSISGYFGYQPHAGYVGHDSFLFEVSDGTDTDQGTIGIGNSLAV